MIFRHTSLKKIAVGLLLALLVFIHTEKAVHHHKKSVATSQQNGYTTASNNFLCSICDYVFAKDADVPVQFILSISVDYSQEQSAQLISHYNRVIIFQITDRGPPAV
ncbi:MAG: hypothetical protein ABIP79_11750 [Chitinophagaceae bacterium]